MLVNTLISIHNVTKPLIFFHLMVTCHHPNVMLSLLFVPKCFTKYFITGKQVSHANDLGSQPKHSACKYLISKHTHKHNFHIFFYRRLVDPMKSKSIV